MLYTNNSEFLSDDYSQCLLDNQAGIETLDALKELFTKGATDALGNSYDVREGKSAMAIVAPWTEGVFKEVLGDSLEETLVWRLFLTCKRRRLYSTAGLWG